MHIVLTNDDGIQAPGLIALYEQLTKLGQVTVVAPEKEKSGASHSITLTSIHCEKISVQNKFEGYAVSGSPADCVKLAIREIIQTPIDLVVSGINYGANVGLNICYSGTVAAALEASFYKIPAIALSAAFEENIDLHRAAEYAINTARSLMPVNPGSVININVPPLSQGPPKGVRIAPQSTHGFEEFYALRETRGERKTYQINGGTHKDHPNQSTDTNLLTQGYITVTALNFNMTDNRQNQKLQSIEFTPGFISEGEKNA